MRFDLLTIFPEFFSGPFDFGILKRARQQGLIEIVIHDLRSFTFDKHHQVDGFVDKLLVLHHFISQ